MSRTDMKASEAVVERAVSEYIKTMWFVCAAIGDDSSIESLRGVIERQSIALLSNYNRKSLDASTDCWLGNSSPRRRVRGSGLWNQNHVENSYDPEFLAMLEKLVTKGDRES